MNKNNFFFTTISCLFFVFFANNSLHADCANWIEMTVNLTPNNHVQVAWRIFENRTTQLYRIERSSDNVKFETVGELSGLQLFDGDNRYKWDDTNPLLGKTFYRIRQIKTTNEECLSPVSYFTYIDDGIQKAQMYPNPCTDYLHLTFYASRYSELTLIFIDDSGVLVRSEIVKVSVGFNSLTISTKGLSTGVYTVDLKNKELAVRRRIIVQAG